MLWDSELISGNRDEQAFDKWILEWRAARNRLQVVGAGGSSITEIISSAPHRTHHKVEKHGRTASVDLPPVVVRLDKRAA